MRWNCLANLIFLLIMIEYGKTELEVVLLKNYTNIFMTEIPETSLVTSVEPFDFVYDDPSILYIHSYKYQEHIKQTYFNASRDRRDAVINVYRTIDLKFDWRMRNIYVAQERFIDVASIDGNYRRTLYWQNMTHVQSIEIDPDKGYIFWALAGVRQQIERASMDGDETSRSIIIKNYIKNPLGLVVDTFNLTLYWSDEFLKVIQKCNYHGNGRETLLQLNAATPGNLALFHTTLFWIDNKNHTVNALSLVTMETKLVSELPQELLQQWYYITKAAIKERSGGVHRHFKLRLFEEQRLQKGYQKENSSNSSTVCGQLTLVSSKWPYFACSCDKDYVAIENGKCISNNIVKPELILGTEAGVLICSNNSISSLYRGNFVLRYALIEEDYSKIIFNKDLNLVVADLWNMSATITQTKSNFIGYANDISYDWIGQNIYFLGNALTESVVFIMKINGDLEVNRKLLRFSYILTKGIAVDPVKRLLFCVNDHTIIKMSMDGNQSTIKTILDRTNIAHVGYGLFIDVHDKDIYWVHLGRYNVVNRVSYNGEILEYPFQKEEIINFYATKTHYITADYSDYGDNWILWMCNKKFGGDCHMLCETPIYIGRMQPYPPDDREYSGVHPCQINNGNCSEMCLLATEYPYFTCLCGESSVMAEDKRSCEKKPCARFNGNCSMFCNNLEGMNYECLCEKGYQLQSDNRTCVGEMGLTAFMIVSGGWKLITLNRNPNVEFLASKNQENLMYFCYDPAKRQVYFTVKVKGRSEIYRSNIYGNEKVYITYDVAIHHLSIDWIIGDLYYQTDTEFVKSALNSTNKQRVILAVLFEDIIDNVAELMKTNLFALFSIGHDIFKGLFYFHIHEMKPGSTMDSIYNENYIVLIEAGIFEKHLPFAKSTLIRYYKAKSHYSSITSIDELGDRLCKEELGLRNDSVNSYVVSYNTDGSGVRMIKNSSDYFTVECHGGNLYLFSSSGSFIKVNTDTLHETKLHQVQATSIGPRWFIIRDLWTDSGKDAECSEIERCWGINNTFECLKPEEICDGSVKCNDGHDERFCKVCDEKDCQITSLKLSCYRYDVLQTKVYPEMIENYVRWTSHPLSNIITLKHILTYDCSVAMEMTSSNSLNMKRYKISSLYHFHRLRQAISSNILRHLEHVENVNFIGSVLLPDALASGIYIFGRMKTFNLEQSHINNLPSLMFQNNSFLNKVTFLDNKYLTNLDPTCFKGLVHLEHLTIKGSFIQIIDGKTLKDLISLTFLNLSANGINILGDGIFDTLSILEIVDLTKNDIKLTSNIFRLTTVLQIIYSDAFTLCCIKPESVHEENCTAEKDDISSCSNLIENRFLASFLWIFGLMAFVGNSAVLVYRSCIDKSIFRKSYYIFIYCLALSDWLMALYMLIIASHDAMYDGVYVWNDYTWKRSPLCMVSGVLSMLSSEASVIFVCLLTIERYLCVKFAFGEIRLSRKNAFLMSIAVCIVAIGLAIVPVFVYPHFFSRSGVCIGIALTPSSVEGLEYSTFIFLGFNFVLSAIIPYGQYSIFTEVKKSSQRVQSSQSGRNIAVAKRLAVVVITDCLCWLPVGILVILSLANVKTPRDVYAWVIIFILPINAAVNPYLYTLTQLEMNKVKECFGMKK